MAKRGDLLLADISIDDARAIPSPTRQTHKHSRGRLAVVAGGALQTGAARLAARSGQRVGGGWVSLFGSRAACEIMACHETSILIGERDETIKLAAQLLEFDAIVVGPAFGLSPSCCADVMNLIESDGAPLVLDADALTHIASAKLRAFPALKARQHACVLTPHSGEFATMFGSFDEKDKVVVSRTAAAQTGCVIVHKGANTVLAGPDGQVFQCDHASPFLATAGTGDVLAGLIGGLLAQNMAAVEACKAAIWLHSQASLEIGPGLIAEDLIAVLPFVLGNLAP